MPFSDMIQAELEQYRPSIREPGDFDAFWSQTLEEARRHDLAVARVAGDTPVSELVIEDLTFAGFGGEPIKAWITRPKRPGGRLPTVIEYNGYNGGRGLPGERLHWAAAGYAHVFMDTRGQGSGWGGGGATPDPHGSGPAGPGFLTKGIENPQDYFYRRLFTDAVRLVDAVSTFEFVDVDHITVTGASQGGAIPLAVAGLVPNLRAVMPDVPFLCNFRRSVELTPDDPFTEITRYLAVHRDRAEQVFETLGYFDGVTFARRAEAPAIFSVALMDTIVLPSTVYAAFNHYAGEDKVIEVYPFNGHEGGQMHQWVRQVRWLNARADADFSPADVDRKLK